MFRRVREFEFQFALVSKRFELANRFRSNSNLLEFLWWTCSALGKHVQKLQKIKKIYPNCWFPEANPKKRRRHKNICTKILCRMVWPIKLTALTATIFDVSWATFMQLSGNIWVISLGKGSNKGHRLGSTTKMKLVQRGSNSKNIQFEFC